jgi:hypothetical protein
MPWEMILSAGLLVLLIAWRARRLQRPRPRSGSLPDVGQPPRDAKPMIEPRLQDIGFGTYELPLPGPAEEMDSGPL